MYDSLEARRTLDPNYMTPYLKRARYAEFVELKKVITEVAKRRESLVDILDIGVGEAIIPVELARTEIWKCIHKYIGIDNSDLSLRGARKNVREYNLSDKVDIRKRDARFLNSRHYSIGRYDLVICTYFTAGDFKPPKLDYSKPKIDEDDISNIANEFERVFRHAYYLLKPKGELVLGSVYIDNPTTALRQRQFYEKCGMKIIGNTTVFTATDKGFWSLRFTEEMIKDLFCFVIPEKIQFTHLDDDDFAMMIRISSDRPPLR